MDVLQGLKQSSKGKLNYDLQPTKQELIEPCTTPLIIGIEYENVLQKFQNATSSSSSPTVKEASKTEGHPRSNEKPKKKEFLANARNDRSMTMYNLNYSMRTDYKKTPDISHVLLRSREKEKAEEVNERAKKRALMYKYHEEKLKEDKRLNLQKQQEELRNKILEDVQALQEDERNKTLQVRNKQREVEIEHREYAARAERKMREVEERQRLIAEEERNRQELAQLCSKHHEIHALVQKLDEAVKQCKYADYLPETTKTFLQESSKVFSLSQNTVKASVDMGRPAENAARLLDEYIGMLKVLLNKGMTAVAEAEQKGIKEKAETEAKKQEEEERKRDEEKKKAERAAAEARKKKEKAKSVPEYLVDCTCDTAFKEYTRLEKLLEKTEKEIEPLASSKEKDMKKLKLELQKAVTTPINTISDTSPSHLLEKIQTLKELLNGRAVTNTGKTISLSSHPLASLYCKNMLAKKIVQQGSGQVSSNHSAAFPSAAVAIGVWSAFPDVGDLILAHFYRECPFLVPLYIPKAQGTSDIDYYKGLGYQISGDQIEAQDKYLKRMTGTVRLYAAIMSSPPPKGTAQPHPLGISHGWTWLARVLNISPRADYTATAVYEFLEVAGHVLVKLYRGQFWKLMQILCQEFVAKIQGVTAESQMGPVVRLKGFLEKCMLSKNFPCPEGFLDSQWWNSSGGNVRLFGY